METLLNILVFGPPLLMAIVCHEVAHGWVAEKLGDPTARNAGRITLNPIKHIDPFFTIILPLLLIFSGSPIVFGAAKPVPVNPYFFRDRDKGMMLVAFAGPLVNFTLAAICLLLLTGLSVFPIFLSIPLIKIPLLWLLQGYFINIVLALFNLLPVPPLDGGRILAGLLTGNARFHFMQLERYGLLIVVGLLYFRVFDRILTPALHFAERMLPL